MFFQCGSRIRIKIKWIQSTEKKNKKMLENIYLFIFVVGVCWYHFLIPSSLPAINLYSRQNINLRKTVLYTQNIFCNKITKFVICYFFSEQKNAPDSETGKNKLL